MDSAFAKLAFSDYGHLPQIGRWWHAYAGLRKLLLATESPRLREVRVKLAYYRATQSELTSSEIPLFCLSSESGRVILSAAYCAPARSLRLFCNDLGPTS